MAKKKLNVGDIVYLVSGGPNMTVTYTDLTDVVICMWFIEDVCEARELHIATLQKVPL